MEIISHGGAMPPITKEDFKKDRIITMKYLNRRIGDFLKELQNGEAFLYATFENGKVGAALSVNVDGSGQSYITVEYKNLTIMQAREKTTLDAL